MFLHRFISSLLNRLDDAETVPNKNEKGVSAEMPNPSKARKPL